MCGIVGFVGQNEATPFLLDGLQKLEYRGYDSAGIAVLNRSIRVRKTQGRLADLRAKVEKEPVSGSIGIGHTRWATHGAPSDQNSHPHLSQNGRFAVVHNGIIENYLELKERLINAGFVFRSETDTEVVAHLFEKLYNGDPVATLRTVIGYLRGSYALAILCVDHPDTLVAVRKDSPLLLGLGEGEQYVASDIPAFLDRTRKCKLLNDGEIVKLTRDEAIIYGRDGQPVEREIYEVNWNVEAAEKQGYETFMRKEIDEQPRALRDCLRFHTADGLLSTLKMKDSEIQSLNRIHIVACGSAYHAGIVGKYVIEELSRIPVEVDLASEFRYRRPIFRPNDLCVMISQSGETADTIAAIREAHANGIPVLSIVNVVGSSIARESEYVLYTNAGPEIAVATTKGYSTQCLMLYLMALKFAMVRGTLTPARRSALTNCLNQLPEQIEELVKLEDMYKEYAAKFAPHEHLFVLGRGIDYGASMEGSLKMKEISYIHSEAYAAGELKHGTISLIEEGSPVVAIATQDALAEKLLSNVREVIARGAQVVLIVNAGDPLFTNINCDVIELPVTDNCFTSSLSVIPMQLIAYHIAKIRGCDIDKPRNLAKSVTVE